MLIESMIVAFEYIFEEDDKGVGEREAILVQSQQQITAIDSQMHKNPETIVFRVSDYYEVADDEVKALGVAHFGEEVSDAFQGVLEITFPTHRQTHRSVYIFLDLAKTGMVKNGVLR